MDRGARLAIAFAVVAVCGAGVWLSGWGRPVAAATIAHPPVERPHTPPPDTRTTPVGLDRVTFAAGCFWCTESDFADVPGVISATSGYTGGTVVDPTYAQVSAGGTGHVEAVEILFDPRVVGLDALLDHYWHNVDFFNEHGQFCDYGEQYRPVVFVHGPEQREIAEASKARLQARFVARIVVPILEASAFYPAEAWHQDYGEKNPLRYCLYRLGCGRNARLAEIWKQAS